MFKNSSFNHLWYIGETEITLPYSSANVTSDVVFTHKEAEDVNAGMVAYIELSGAKTYYASLQDAVNALGGIYSAVTTANLTDEDLWEAAGSPIITLYKDINITSTIEPSWWNTNYDANRVRTVVIKGVKEDGTNAKITSTVGGSAIRYNAYYNLTLEDIDMECPNGFALFWSGYSGGKNSGKSTTNMINCNITAKGTSGEGLVFKVTGNQIADSKTEEYIINMVNTHVEAIAGVNAVFLFHHGARFVALAAPWVSLSSTDNCKSG